MNNKYSVACITLVRDKYTVRLHGAPCSSLDGVTVCVVYTADSIRNRIGRPIRFEIRFERKKRFAGPYFSMPFLNSITALVYVCRLTEATTADTEISYAFVSVAPGLLKIHNTKHTLLQHLD